MNQGNAAASRGDAPHRAVIYLRVSSRGQLETDVDEDGLSIAAQRSRCEQVAGDYHATVTERDIYIERAESAKTDDRPELRRMLTRIREQRDVDYVILWKVDRFARNRRDDANMLFDIEMAGAQLISATENIDQTPAGRLMHGMLASFAEYYSRNLAHEVLKGATEKAKRGGTPGRAPLGYLNVRELIDGHEIRTVVIDPDRAPIIRWAFEAYATGVYSASDMVALLEARGLKTRGNRRFSPRPLSSSTILDMLANPYYTGVVRYCDKSYKGRHEPLVSEELFERVQAVLRAHHQSGERDRKHAHYLKGSVYCGHCGRRLTYSRNKGNGGYYEYFVCAANQRRGCPQPAQRIDQVEAAIERYYATIRLNVADRSRIQDALEDYLSQQAAVSQQETRRCQDVLNRILEEERKLLNAHYQDRVSPELYAAEQARITRERKSAEAIIARLSLETDDLQALIAQALRLASADLQTLYLQAGPMVRRFMNQAIFEALWVAHDDIADALLTSPFQELRDLCASLEQTSEARTTGTKANTRALSSVGARWVGDGKAPDSLGESGALDGGSIRTEMVERTWRRTNRARVGGAALDLA